MDTERTEITSSNLKKGDVKQNAKTCDPGTTSVGAGKTTRTNGAAIGGDAGHAIGDRGDVAVGAVARGIAARKNTIGKTAAKPVNPSAEHEFWRREFVSRPYFTHGTPYDQYGPAFEYGWVSFASHNGKTFEDVEPELARDWPNHRGKSKLSWNHAKGATYDAWERAEQAACVDSCSSA